MADPKRKPTHEPRVRRTVREITSRELFDDARTVVITHEGEQYRLMITRNDKLILQK